MPLGQDAGSGEAGGGQQLQAREGRLMCGGAEVGHDAVAGTGQNCDQKGAVPAGLNQNRTRLLRDILHVW